MFAYRAETASARAPERNIARIVETTQRSPGYTLCVALFVLSAIGMTITVAIAGTVNEQILFAVSGTGQLLLWGMSAILTRRRVFVVYELGKE